MDYTTRLVSRLATLAVAAVAAVGVAGEITRRAQVKVELVDSYKTRPPDATTKKNDVALVTAIVYTF